MRYKNLSKLKNMKGHKLGTKIITKLNKLFQNIIPKENETN